MAVNQLGDTLAGSGSAFASDDDPELIKAAAPFSLKLVEGLLEQNPRHRGLLLAAARGFVQYTYGFVEQERDEKEDSDLATADLLRARAKRLYLRARGYGLRGLALNHPGLEDNLRLNPKQAVEAAKVSDVPFLYWTAAAWGGAISMGKDDPALVADQGIVEALMDRALELDESFEHGAIHLFLIPYEMVRPGARGDASERARKHFERAMELADGHLAAPLVSLAEAVCVQTQNRAEFQSLLARALSINADAVPRWRLQNLLAQRRARWLQGRVDELFLSGTSTGRK